ncbi:MAG TPA: Ppx/GppA phosphatase family protein [Gemmatales bacterium]|nr:Ppx/GppA phosphatase family protein [Gemmatales bacterium]
MSRLAGIDIGSNSIRLIIAEVNDDRSSYRVLDDHKETTRLAHGLSATSKLSAEAMAHSLNALRRMKALVDGHKVDHLEVIATSAVREARNGQEFIQLVKAHLGVTIEVITPDEEGRLSFLSAHRRFDLSDQQVLLLDLGGGSGELIFAANGVVEEIHSLPIGAVRMTEDCITHDPPNKNDVKALRKRLKKLLTDSMPVAAFHPHFMIGAGGTFTALANISLRMRGMDRRGVGGYEMTRSEVRHVLDHLSFLPLAARRTVPGLNPDRADIIIAGISVIERIMKWMQVNRLVIHDQGVRDGLLLNMIEKYYGPPKTENNPVAEDPEALQAAARQFGSLCGLDEAHAAQITKLCSQLFDALQEPLKLPPAEKTMLLLAAWLHEVGTLVNYEKHHHHSYHLIVHGNIRGMTPRQREIVAQVARYHRRSVPKKKHEAFARLSDADQATIRRLSAILRLADGMDRSHTRSIEKVQCTVRGSLVHVAMVAPTYPEIDVWGASQKGKLFEKVFGKELELVWQPPLERAG